jgi:hypothetical protein
MLYGAVTDAGQSGQKELAVALVSEFLAGMPNNFYRSSDTFVFLFLILSTSIFIIL